MRAGRPSWSAEGVASVRALETLIYPPHRRVFDDPIASRVLGGRFRLVQRSRLIGRAVGWIHQHRYAGMPHEVVARARFAQTTLARLAAAGVRQVAILGAGVDPTA